MLVPVVDMKLTGQNIASLRTQRGISVRDLQLMLGFTTPQSIYKWQRGETLPTIENLAALACSSIGRALPFQGGCCEFESRLPLH